MMLWSSLHSGDDDRRASTVVWCLSASQSWAARHAAASSVAAACAPAIKRSVAPLIADTTTTVGEYCWLASMIPATVETRAALPSEVPPNLWTIISDSHLEWRIR